MSYCKYLDRQLQDAFEKDLTESSEINTEQWLARPKHSHLWEKPVRLLSPFL